MIDRQLENPRKWMMTQPPMLIAQAKTMKRALDIKHELKCDSVTATILALAPLLRKEADGL